jgi:hypothetical protein
MHREESSAFYRTHTKKKAPTAYKEKGLAGQGDELEEL